MDVTLCATPMRISSRRARLIAFELVHVPVTMTDDPTAGQNPPYGAAINYYLKSAPSDVKIRIEDARGETVRTITGTRTVGINRVNWDLRSEPTKEVRLRTSPAYAPEIRNNPDGWRLAPDGARMSVLMPPGTYTVKLLIAGADATPALTQQLIVQEGSQQCRYGSRYQCAAWYCCGSCARIWKTQRTW